MTASIAGYRVEGRLTEASSSGPGYGLIRPHHLREWGAELQYVEALQEYHPGSLLAVFLAGGITGCPDWQQEVAALLRDEPVVLLNPRRAAFPINDPAAGPQQIAWEHFHLRLADAILFWFPQETLCPIALYELGAWSMTQKPLFVGVHPDYLRRQDVEIQTRLIRPDVPVVYSVADLVEQLRCWLRAGMKQTVALSVRCPANSNKQ